MEDENYEVDSSSDDDEIPLDVQESANAAGDGVPEKSRKLYEDSYSAFKKWKTEKKISPNKFKKNYEQILLAYFSEQSKLKKPNTLWSTYSKLKLMLNAYEGISIEGCHRLKAFIKRRNEGYMSKKSKVFTAEHINKFLSDAPDEVYLAQKVKYQYKYQNALVSVINYCHNIL